MTLKSKQYKLTELVSPVCYKTYGEFAWNFFGQDIITDIDLIASTYKAKYGYKPYINNGATFTESGLRINIDSLVKAKKGAYVSGHILAIAFDFKDQKGKHEQLWQHIKDLIVNKKLKRFKRLEDRKSAPTWTHTDGFQTPDGLLQVFKG